MSAVEYVELLDWLVRQVVPGKRGSTQEDAPAVFEPQSSAATFCELVANFGKLFKIVAGKPHVIDAHRGVRRLDGSVIAGYCI